MPVQPQHAHSAVLIYTALASFVSGGGVIRFLIYVSSNMPPLPKNAGWWTQLVYSLVKGTSGLDPSAAIVPPPSGGAIK
jgi:hypothetical protein